MHPPKGDQIEINPRIARGALQKSGIGDFDYVINPYFGCAHACSYCYARFMLKFNPTGHEWGDFVEPKINLPDVLAREAKKAAGKKILFSSVTDCYQPVEKGFGITRECLKILARQGGNVSILTKSSLAVRDADIVQEFMEFTFGMSASFHDERTRLCFECGSSTLGQKAATLKAMKKAGAKTWLYVSPILPGITDIRKILEHFAGSIDHASFEAYNPYPATIPPMRRSLAKAGLNPDEFFRLAKNRLAWPMIRQEAEKACNDLGIRFGEFHSH